MVRLDIHYLHPWCNVHYFKINVSIVKQTSNALKTHALCKRRNKCVHINISRSFWGLPHCLPRFNFPVLRVCREPCANILLRRILRFPMRREGSRGPVRERLNSREGQTDSTHSTPVDKYYFTWSKERHSMFP